MGFITSCMTKPSAVLKTDVLIVGGGPAGCSLAAILGKAGINVVCVDQDAPQSRGKDSFDGRTMAISYGSSRIIDKSGAWENIIKNACPIKTIHVMESGSPVLLDFMAKDADTDSLGWIIENKNLRQALFENLRHIPSCIHLAPAKICHFEPQEKSIVAITQDGQKILAQLVIGADGRKSFTRQWMKIETRGWDYQQRAIVCIVGHEKPHNNIAVEDFRKDGPIAILPMNDDEHGGHRSSIVWTESSHEKDSCLTWNEPTFQAALQERFPSCYGKVYPLGQKFSYPLSLAHAHSYIGSRMALVADAAHGIHPIAGQGLNLGLRDIDALSLLLIDAKEKNQDLGSPDILLAYEKQRRRDNSVMAGATDGLDKLFSNNSSTLRIARKTGLKLIQKIPRVRAFFMKQAMGISTIK